MISIVHGLKEYHLEPKIGVRYTYRFETVHDDFANEKKAISTSYTREIWIMPIARQDTLDVYQIFLAKMTIKSNVAVADEYLIKQLAYVFDEIEVAVDFSGKIVSIYNMGALRFRWRLKRVKLEQEYVGVTVQAYFRTIDVLLDDEQKLIQFLSSYKMFGIYFHGLFGNYLLWEMPLKRAIRLDDFDRELVNEKIFPEKKEAIKYKIQGSGAGLVHYGGELIYSNFQLKEALIECGNHSQSFKYGALFLG